MLRDEIITVFGGSGFIGRYVVRALAKAGYRVRVATRRPHLAQDMKVSGVVGQVQLTQANLRNPDSVARAVDGAHGVINLVGVLFEAGRQNFSKLHGEGPGLIAQAAAEAGVERLIHVSAIGADAESKSRYARSKAAGEAAVREAFHRAIILRPSIVFGAEDDFFNRFADMARFAPFLPLIGGGKTKFQPVYVADVAEAAVNALAAADAPVEIFELGGPGVYSFKQLLAYILETIDRPRLLIPLPFPVATGMGLAGEMAAILPFVQPFLTRDQVTLLRSDNVVSDGAKTLSDLCVKPDTVEAVVPTYLGRYRRYGQFHERAES